MNHSSDDLEGFGMLLIGLALLIFAGAIAALVWYAITTLVILVRYHIYHQQREEGYQQVEAYLGVGYDPDDVFRSIFGEGIDLSDGGIDNSVDWFAETVIGRSRKTDEAA
jgi:hypothetical protein